MHASDCYMHTHIAGLQELNQINALVSLFFFGRHCCYLGYCGPQPGISVGEMWNSTQSFVTEKAGGQAFGSNIQRNQKEERGGV